MSARMVFSFWSASAARQHATRVEYLRQAETGLLNLAQKYFEPSNSDAHRPQIRSFDTTIPRSSIPFKPSCGQCLLGSTPVDTKNLVIHGVQVTDSSINSGMGKSEYPLVALHGYYNGGAYFCRNMVGLAAYYGQVFCLDQLGWGLSSRPDFSDLKDDSVQTKEDFFVESLEQWREKNGIEKMVLCGHSMGGYMSVAYCERYPERVERLLLLSPVGVPDDSDPSFQERLQRINATWRGRMFFGFLQSIFHVTTVGAILRSMSEARGYGLIRSYITRRLPGISDPLEQETLTDYLYYNATLPGSGEHGIHVLNSNIMAKKPLQDRIPNLQVEKVCFMYGQADWMDMSAALTTQQICESKDKGTAPSVEVYVVRSAGHLLMLENPQETNAILIHAGGGLVPKEKLPILVTPTKKEMPNPVIHQTVLPSQ